MKFKMIVCYVVAVLYMIVGVGAMVKSGGNNWFFLAGFGSMMYGWGLLTRTWEAKWY